MPRLFDVVPTTAPALIASAGFVVALVVAVGASGVHPADRLTLVGSVVVVTGLVAAAVRTKTADDTLDDGAWTRGEESGSVWDLIPRWQYSGRHYEGAGATREEQERALEEIEERARELENEHEPER